MDEKKIPTIDLSPFLLLAGRRVNDKRGGGREEEEEEEEEEEKEEEEEGEKILESKSSLDTLPTEGLDKLSTIEEDEVKEEDEDDNIKKTIT